MSRRRVLGVWVLVSSLLWFPAAGRAAERTLIVVLDAVPYGTMERLASRREEPLFAGFEKPRPLISTFPSSTSVALPGIFADLGLARSPGYEARFFDWQDGRRKGGGMWSYFRFAFPWRSFFDWNRKGPIRNALHAARPIKSGVGEIRRAMAAFRADRSELFKIYIAETDTVAHLLGPDALEPLLAALDEELRAIDGARVVLLSDHGLAGGAPLVNVLPAVRRRLTGLGWDLAGRYRSLDDVVLAPFGLVSSFEAYSAPERAPELAVALAGTEGVELCVAPLPASASAGAEASRWRAAEAGATLTFERRSGPDGIAWRWQGGAAGMALMETLPAGLEEVWVADNELLRLTAAAALPDPLHRLAGAFALVKNPASVVCSLAPGHMFGSRGAERSARWTKGQLRWTHGSLRRAASLGFVMSNPPAAAPKPRNAPEAIRFDRVLERVLPSSVESASPQ